MKKFLSKLILIVVIITTFLTICFYLYPIPADSFCQNTDKIIITRIDFSMKDSLPDIQYTNYTVAADMEEYETFQKILPIYTCHRTFSYSDNANPEWLTFFQSALDIDGNNWNDYYYSIILTDDESTEVIQIILSETEGNIITPSANYRIGYMGNKKAMQLCKDIDTLVASMIPTAN